MKVQEVICRVLAGTLTWLQGADILGIHTRSLRRWRARYERDGVLGLYDGRRGQPSRRKAPSRRSNASCACIASATARATGTPASYTPTAGGKVDLTRPTQLGHALTRLGIVHIPSYSPQGRGRGERLNRTLQGRLINELRVAGITHGGGGQRLPARALHRRLRRPVHLPAGGPGPGRRGARDRRPGSHPVPGGRAHRRPRQCRRPRTSNRDDHTCPCVAVTTHILEPNQNHFTPPDPRP